jgi:hypothetical protein
VLAALNIIAALDKPFFMENPYTGLLKSRPIMQDQPPPKVVDCCNYGSAHRKRTAIWTHTSWEPSQPLCRHDCPGSVGKRHLQHAQRGSRTSMPGGQKVMKLYTLPPALCQEIAAFMIGQLAPTSPAAQEP